MQTKETRSHRFGSKQQNGRHRSYPTPAQTADHPILYSKNRSSKRAHRRRSIAGSAPSPYEPIANRTRIPLYPEIRTNAPDTGKGRIPHHRFSGQLPEGPNPARASASISSTIFCAAGQPEHPEEHAHEEQLHPFAFPLMIDFRARITADSSTARTTTVPKVTIAPFHPEQRRGSIGNPVVSILRTGLPTPHRFPIGSQRQAARLLARPAGGVRPGTPGPQGR